MWLLCRRFCPNNQLDYKIIISELLFILLISCAVVAAVYDYCMEDEHWISAVVNRIIHRDPVIALLCGLLIGPMICFISRVWQISVRHVLALIVLGFVLGHLFWAQSRPYY